MSADPVDKFFARSHATLGEQEVFHPVGDIRPTKEKRALAVYLNLDFLSVDVEKQLWVSRTAPALTDNEALAINQAGNIDLFRFIIIPNRRMVDLSAGSFTLNNESPDRLAVDKDYRFDTADWIKVTGESIREAGERRAVEARIKKKYKISIGESVLAIASALIEDQEDEFSDDPVN